LDAGEERIVRKLTTSSKSITSDLISQVIDRGMLTKFNPEAFAKLKPKYLKDMNIIFKNYFVDLFNKSYDTARAEIFPEQAGKKFAIELLPEEFLALLQAEAFDMVGKYAFNVTERIKNIVRQGIKDGYGQGEIVKMCREEMAAESDRWINTTVRTKSTEIYNEARKKYYETDDLAKQVVEAYQWSAILDDRTSDVCTFLDGKIWDIGELSDIVKPPAHFNCRSILVPITKYEDYKSDDNYVKRLNIDDLVDKGGSLLVPNGSGTKKMAQEYKDLAAAQIIESYGEHIILTNPAPDKRLNIVGIYASNLDLERPVTVGFKDSLEQDLRYTTVLVKAGGVFNKDFAQGSAWQLQKGSDFIMFASAPVRIDLTVRYFISDEIISEPIPVEPIQ
jgi:SPP1 gp7 family putative phage head morphogenesis protein